MAKNRISEFRTYNCVAEQNQLIHCPYNQKRLVELENSPVLWVIQSEAHNILNKDTYLGFPPPKDCPERGGAFPHAFRTTLTS